MQKKIDMLRGLMEAGQWEAAIKFAAKFPRLGEQEPAIRRASSALLSPGLYAGMGRDPAALVAAGRAALMQRYPLPR